MEKANIVQKESCASHKSVHTPIADSCSDDIIRSCVCQNAKACACLATTLLGIRNIFSDMFLNCAHTELIAKVTDREIVHSSVLTFSEKNIIFCLNISCVYSDCVVIIAVFVSARCFV